MNTYNPRAPDKEWLLDSFAQMLSGCSKSSMPKNELTLHLLLARLLSWGQASVFLWCAKLVFWVLEPPFSPSLCTAPVGGGTLLIRVSGLTQVFVDPQGLSIPGVPVFPHHSLNSTEACLPSHFCAFFIRLQAPCKKSLGIIYLEYQL